MKYEKSIQAMFKAGRVRATAVTEDHVRNAERYGHLALARCDDEAAPAYLKQAAYNDGLRGLQSPSYDGIA